MSSLVQAFEERINHPSIFQAFVDYLVDDNSAKRMLQIARTEFYKNPELKNCDLESVLECIKKTVQLGLSLDSTLGHAALIPRYNGQGNLKKCQFMPMYKGYLYLGYKYGGVGFVDAYLVRNDDEFNYEIIDGEPKIKHVPKLGSKEKIIATYVVIKFKSGEKKICLIDENEIQKSKDASETKPYKNSKGEIVQPPWVKYEEEMCKKTSIRKAFKLINTCPEIAAVVTLDELQEAGVDQKLIEPPVYETEYENIDKPKQIEKPAENPNQDFIDDMDRTPPLGANEKDRLTIIEGLKDMFARKNYDPATVKERLKAKFGVEKLNDLKFEQVSELLNDLKGKV